MEALYTEALICTQGEEKAPGLLESIQLQTENPIWLEYAATLTQQAIHDFQMRAVEVDGHIEALTVPLEFKNSAITDMEAKITRMKDKLAVETARLAQAEEKLLELKQKLWPHFTSQAMKTLETFEANLTAINVTEDKTSLFQTAVTNGDATLVDLCIQAGVDPSVQDNSAIQEASSNGHLPVVNRLLEDERVDPSVTNNAAVRFASYNRHLPVVDRLLQDVRVISTLSTHPITSYPRCLATRIRKCRAAAV